MELKGKKLNILGDSITRRRGRQRGRNMALCGCLKTGAAPFAATTASRAPASRPSTASPPATIFAPGRCR